MFPQTRPSPPVQSVLIGLNRCFHFDTCSGAKPHTAPIKQARHVNSIEILILWSNIRCYSHHPIIGIILAYSQRGEFPKLTLLSVCLNVLLSDSESF